MTEQVRLFGHGNGLSGIVTDAAGSTGVVFLNAGVLHRVGPSRLHVTLARALADKGFASLRFDFSGIGESETRMDEMPERERILSESQAAMDVLTEKGASRFLLVGLCSGADNALRIAIEDSRVLGVVALQPHSFGSPGFAFETYARRVMAPRTWARLFGGSVSLRNVGASLWNALRRSPRSVGAAPRSARSLAGHVAAEIRGVIERGVDMLLVYSVPSSAHYNFRTLVAPELKRLEGPGRVEVETFTGSDHTFSPLAHQARLVERIAAWAGSCDARRALVPGRGTGQEGRDASR